MKPNRSYSYSMLSAAYKCNHYFKLIYVDKLKPTGPESADLHFGTAMHTALLEIHEAGTYDSFKAYWDSLKDPISHPEVSYGRYPHEDLENQALRLLERYRRLYVGHLKPVKMEERLYAETMSGIRLEGTPDFIGMYKGVPCVADYKTAAYRYPKEKIGCSDQLVLYTYLAYRTLGFKAKKIIYLVLTKGREPGIQTLEQDIDVDSDEFHERMKNIEAQCKELEAKQVFTKNHNACIMGQYRCEMYNVCHKEKSDE